MEMPSEVVFSFDTKEEWDLGISLGISTSAVPGSLTPIGDFLQSFAPGWAGSKSKTAVYSGQLGLSGITFANANDGVHQTVHVNTGYTIYLGQKLTARGRLISFTVKAEFASYNSTIMYPFVAKYSTGEILWVSSIGYDNGGYTRDTFVGYPDVLLTEDVVVGVRSRGDQFNDPCSFCFGAAASAAPNTDGVWVYQTRHGISPPTPPTGNWLPGGRYYGYVSYQLGYEESGTWTSSWIQHGVTIPKTAFAEWVSNALSQGTVSLEVRHSDDNGVTYSDWLPVTNASLIPGSLLKYIQFRLTLTTEDADSFSPLISSLKVIVQPEHRWISPPYDLSDEKITWLMLATSDCDVLKSFKYGHFDDSAEFIEDGDIPSLLFEKSIIPTTQKVVYFLGSTFPAEIAEPIAGPSAVSFAMDISSMSALASVDKLTLYKAVLLQTLEDPVINVRPPEITDVIVFVQDSEPLIEASASLGVSEDQKVEVRFAAPAGSTQQYAQDLADAYLSLHGVEKKSITCKVPLASRVSFGELIAVAIPFWGFTVNNPWYAMVQKIIHRPLGNPPHTELSLGDFEPDDTEALIRLLGKKE